MQSNVLKRYLKISKIVLTISFLRDFRCFLLKLVKRLRIAILCYDGRMWQVYILETKDGSLYTGMTNNIERRMRQHRAGKGARFTRIFGFKKLLFCAEYSTRSEAMKRESEIKRWPRAKKILLIKGKNKAL